MELPAIIPRPVQAARPAPAAQSSPAADAAARATAVAFETAFLAEMLKHTGVNRAPEGWGGGAGEEAFASFLTQEYARLLAERGGVGLADHIVDAIHGKDSGL